MVYIFLATGFEEIESITVLDLLIRAGIQVKSVSVMEDKLVYGSKGIAVEADMLLKNCDFKNCQMIVLPGGMPGTINLCNHKALNEELLEFNNSEKKIGAICAAPMVLGRLGILRGLKATIYDGMEDELAGATYIKDNVVVSNNIITSRGPATAIEFALKLIEEISGIEKSEAIAREILLK